MRNHAPALAIGLVFTALPAAGQDNTVNRPGFDTPEGKSQYTLFNPTPRELRRPLGADRPDITESPYTVDAGAFQLEMSFFDYAKNGDVDTWTAAPFNLKLGLTNDIDLQFVADPWVFVDGDGIDEDGFGDIQFRLKWNVWGNDRGDTAFAVMPFVKIPTAEDDIGNDEFEGGVIFPFAMSISDNLGLGLMGEVDFVYDEVDEDHDVEFLHSAVLGVGLTEEIGWYIEGVGIVSGDSDSDYRALLGSGFTYAVSEDLVFDVGVNLGLTGDTDDVNVFTGMTLRF